MILSSSTARFVQRKDTARLREVQRNGTTIGTVSGGVLTAVVTANRRHASLRQQQTQVLGAFETGRSQQRFITTLPMTTETLGTSLFENRGHFLGLVIGLVDAPNANANANAQDRRALRNVSQSIGAADIARVLCRPHIAYQTRDQTHANGAQSTVALACVRSAHLDVTSGCSHISA